MTNLEIMENAGIGMEHLAAYENAPKYLMATPCGDTVEIQAFPKVAGLKYPGWMVFHDADGIIYIKDRNNTEVCRYDETNGDVLYVGNIDVGGLWEEVKDRFSIQKTLLRPWNQFPAMVSLKDIRDWFEGEFAVNFEGGEPIEAC